MNEETTAAAVKIATAATGAGTAWALSDYAAIVAIVAGTLSAAYAALQIYVLWRDKIQRGKA